MRQDSTSIFVFGEALVDDFASGPVVGGAPFNVARHLAAFGLSPLMCTRIGNDANGERVREQFRQFGMKEDALQLDPVRPTGRVQVEEGQGEHRFIILPDQAYDHIEALAPAAKPARFYFGTLAQRAPGSRAALEKLLAATDAPRFLDLNLRGDQVATEVVLESLRRADLVKVNDAELLWLHDALGRPRPEGEDILGDAAAEACLDLIRRIGLRGMVVTLGARGAAWFGADGARLVAHAGAPVAVIDTVGAGDAFSSVFLLGDVLGWPIAATLQRANEFAAAICAIRGAVPANTGFYAPWRSRWLPDIT
jgi:fructokinase